MLTVLEDGDDTSEPVADAARSMLDGHVVLDRKLAERGHFPAIDLSASVSRVSREITTPNQQRQALAIRDLLGEYSEVEDLIRIGAYQAGTSPEIDRAIRMKPMIDGFLRQAPGQFVSWQQTLEELNQICETAAVRIAS